jgi:hypothetical protein
MRHKIDVVCLLFRLESCSKWAGTAQSVTWLAAGWKLGFGLHTGAVICPASKIPAASYQLFTDGSFLDGKRAKPNTVRSKAFQLNSWVVRQIPDSHIISVSSFIIILLSMPWNKFSGKRFGKEPRNQIKTTEEWNRPFSFVQCWC